MIDKYNGETVLVVDRKVVDNFKFEDGGMLFSDEIFYNEKVGLYQYPDIVISKNIFEGQGNSRFMLRCLAEEDESVKQLIPYIVVVEGDKIFHYQRGSSSGEDRLKKKFSIGIGGHVNECDRLSSHVIETVLNAAKREFEEEIGREMCEGCVLGMINDDSDNVGKVHLGLLLVMAAYEVIGPMVTESAIEKGRMCEVVELSSGEAYDTLEPWSKIALGMIKKVGW